MSKELVRFIQHDQTRARWMLAPFEFITGHRHYAGATDGHRIAIVAGAQVTILLSEHAPFATTIDSGALAMISGFAAPFVRARTFHVSPTELEAWAGSPVPLSVLPPCVLCFGSGAVDCPDCGGDGYGCTRIAKCEGSVDCTCGRTMPQRTREPGYVGQFVFDRRLARDAVALFADIAPGEMIEVQPPSEARDPVMLRAGRATFVLMPCVVEANESTPRLGPSAGKPVMVHGAGEGT